VTGPGGAGVRAPEFEVVADLEHRYDRGELGEPKVDVRVRADKQEPSHGRRHTGTDIRTLSDGIFFVAKYRFWPKGWVL